MHVTGDPVIVGMWMCVGMRMAVYVGVVSGFGSIALSLRGQVDIKLGSTNGSLDPGFGVDVVALEWQLRQSLPKFAYGHAEIQKCPHEHVAGDSRGQVQIQMFHHLSEGEPISAGLASWLIALAA